MQLSNEKQALLAPDIERHVFNMARSLETTLDCWVCIQELLGEHDAQMVPEEFWDKWVNIAQTSNDHLHLLGQMLPVADPHLFKAFPHLSQELKEFMQNTAARLKRIT